LTIWKLFILKRHTRDAKIFRKKGAVAHAFTNPPAAAATVSGLRKNLAKRQKIVPESIDFKKLLLQLHTQHGESILELSHRAPVLLIFLRHFG